MKCDTWPQNLYHQSWLTVQVSSSVLRYTSCKYRNWIGLRRCLNHWTTLKAVSTSKIRKLSERSDFWAFCRLPMITLLISKSYQYLNVYSRNITKGICVKLSFRFIGSILSFIRRRTDVWNGNCYIEWRIYIIYTQFSKILHIIFLNYLVNLITDAIKCTVLLDL